MTIIYRPLEAAKTEKPQQSQKTTSDKFSNMLSQHLDDVRSHKPVNSTQNQTTPDKSDNNLEVLKDVDQEYYQKGVKKQTLAESFSSRNKADLETRIKKYQPIIEAKAKKYGLDPNLLAGLIRQESNFNPYAVSKCGAMGLGQLMPETARGLGVKDPFNASQNLDGAAKYLREQLDTFGGNVDKALAAYNAGPGAVIKHGGIPPYRETQNYVRSIRSHITQIASLEVFEKKKA